MELDWANEIERQQVVALTGSSDGYELVLGSDLLYSPGVLSARLKPWRVLVCAALKSVTRISSAPMRSTSRVQMLGMASLMAYRCAWNELVQTAILSTPRSTG